MIVAINPYSSVEASEIVPFIASTNPLTINSPSPDPLVVLVISSSNLINFSNNFLSFFLGILSHWFLTVIIALIVIIRRRNKPVINRWKNLENEEFTVLVEDEKEKIQPDVTQTGINEAAVLPNDSEQDCFEIDIEKAFDENEIITETQENEQE